MYAILKQKLYNFTANTLKAYISVQAASLSAFVISNTHISGQKPCGRQLNTKVCGSESAIFRILLSFFLCSAFNLSTMISRKWFKYSPSSLSQLGALRSLSVFITSNSPWSINSVHNTLWLLSVVKDAIF